MYLHLLPTPTLFIMDLSTGEIASQSVSSFSFAFTLVKADRKFLMVGVFDLMFVLICLFYFFLWIFSGTRSLVNNSLGPTNYN